MFSGPKTTESRAPQTPYPTHAPDRLTLYMKIPRPLALHMPSSLKSAKSPNPLPYTCPRPTYPIHKDPQTTCPIHAPAPGLLYTRRSPGRLPYTCPRASNRPSPQTTYCFTHNNQVKINNYSTPFKITRDISLLHSRHIFVSSTPSPGTNPTSHSAP